MEDDSEPGVERTGEYTGYPSAPWPERRLTPAAARQWSCLLAADRHCDRGGATVHGTDTGQAPKRLQIMVTQ